jgi:Fe-Mn family superoxide dismutase
MENAPSNTLDSHSIEPRLAADLTRRAFLRSGSCLVGAAAMHTVSTIAFSDLHQQQPVSISGDSTMPFQLPPLPYAFDALEPFIDAQTMEIHHDKHHAAYVKNLNAALEGDDKLRDMTLNQLLTSLPSLPEGIRATVRNNAGGHANHSLFWKLLKKNDGAAPTGEFAAKLDSDFGSFEQFKTAFQDAGTKLFGSGWVFLVADPKNQGKLKLHPMPNQDSVISEGLTPILGNDVWEHAYYLKYQNKRPDYLAAWWNVVNWDFVATRYEAIKSGNEKELATD